MAQIMIDLKNCERINQILEAGLQEANQNEPKQDKTQQNVAAEKTAAASENNNNGQNLQSHSIFNQHIELSNVILDPDVENILQYLPHNDFCCCFSLDKVMVRCLLVEMHQRAYYHPINDMHNAISFDKSVLATLSYLVNGHYVCLQALSYFEMYSSEQLRHCVQRTCQILVHFLSPVYVRFPCSPEEQRNVKSGFLRHFGVPGVVGVMECYHVHLENVPQHQLYMYLRRQYMQPSLAVQVICDHNYRFLDVNPRFSGNTSKHHVWKNSHVKHIVHHAQEKEPNIWLIADSGYHLSSVVINPYRNVCNNQEVSVNMALMDIQHVVDKAFALLQARFKCLSCYLPFSHEHAANVISSCVTLHNYLLSKNMNNVVNISVSESNVNILKTGKYVNRCSPNGLLNRNFMKKIYFTPQ